MIPLIEWKIIDLGPLDIQVWGLFVGLGFLLGGAVAAWFAKRQKIDPKLVFDLLPWLILAGLLGGRFGHVVFYEPAYYLAHPLEAFAIWEGGLSIYGGFIVCLFVGLWWMRRKQVDIFKFSDLLIFGLPWGMWLGRLGCFLIHDHPGTASDFILAAKFPDGIIRHDLGLYESLNGLVMGLVFLWLVLKPRPVGIYIVIFSLWYGTVRFFLDFLRVGDSRYLGLTPAQYLSIVLLLFGIGIALWIRNKKNKLTLSRL